MNAPAIDIYLTPQPYGLGAGEPVFELVFRGVPASYEAQQRVKSTLALLANSAPGVTGCWISSAPWGADGLDEAVFQICGDETVRSVRATIPAVGAESSALSLGWIADASQQMREARSAVDLQQQLTRQLVIPLCTDLVVMEPHTDNLTPAHLDALMTFTAVGEHQVAGYLGVKPDDLELAMYAAAKATGSWRVQALGPAVPRVLLKTEACG